MANNILQEGIIYQGFLKSKKDFIQEFRIFFQKEGTSFINAIQTKILNKLNNLSHYWMDNSLYRGYVFKEQEGLTKELKIDIYKSWEAIQKEFFGNDSVQLLAGISMDEGKTYLLNTTIPIEQDVINANNGLKFSKNMFSDLLDTGEKATNNKKISDMFNKHYGDLLIQLDCILSKEQAAELHEMIPRHYKKFPNWTGHSPNEIFYSNKSNYGNRFDGYMNHVARKEPELFTLLGNKNPINVEKSDLHKFTFDDELKQIIKTSLNTIPWYTGGDIIIIRDDGSVAYNLQLKTTIKDRAEWNIKLSKFYTFLNDVTNSKNYLEMANILYENLKTEVSGVLTSNTEKKEEEIILDNASKIILGK